MAEKTISSDAEINSIRVKEQASAPDTPASGYGQIYLKDDGKLYFKNDAGVEVEVHPPVTLADGSPGLLDGQELDLSGIELDDLADVDLTTFPPEDGDVLVYDAYDGVWIPGEGAAGSGDMTKAVYDQDDDGVVDLAPDHDHSGDAGDGGTFDAANLTSGAADDGYVLTADGAGGAAWEAPPAGGAVDAADVTFTPTTLTDWDSDADPGDVDGALDQLAERVDDLEGAGPGGGSSILEVQVFS